MVFKKGVWGGQRNKRKEKEEFKMAQVLSLRIEKQVDDRESECFSPYPQYPEWGSRGQAGTYPGYTDKNKQTNNLM